LVDLFEYMMMHGLTNPKRLDMFICDTKLMASCPMEIEETL